MVGNDGRLADDDRWWGMMAGWRMVAGWRMMTDGRGEKFFAPTIGRGMGDGGAIYRRSGDGGWRGDIPPVGGWGMVGRYTAGRGMDAVMSGCT